MLSTTQPGRRRAAGASALLALSLVTGCGSATGTPAVGGSEGAGAAADSKGLAQAEADYKAALNVANLELPMPTDAIDPGHKKVAIISIGQNSTSGVYETRFLEQAAKDIGWTPTVFDGQLDVGKIANYIEQASQSDFDAIVYEGLDAALLKTSIEGALKSGKLVGGFNVVNTVLQDQIILASDDFTNEGRMAAVAMVANSGGKAKIKMYYDKQYALVVNRVEGASAYIQEMCPACTIDKETVSSADLAQPGPPYFSAFLSTNPKGKFTDVLGYSDGAAQAYAKTAAAAGRMDLSITTFDALPAAIAELKNKDYNVSAVTTNNWEYHAYAMMDLLARQMQGKPLWKGADSTKVGLVDKSTADAYPTDGTSPNSAKYVAQFKKLWGKP
ncbi:substrate-binding domain-containing protein [Pseudarthrobacter sp. B4EP4b]|uniref:sugar ABC transporter substrate-binding protein n=1 Tax=Pseudarthrobacter sp. B4EP4b TaxID=2590664 RepID=UPI0015EFC6E0|nr:substrate-binding domain-containing protein [Pseudarthrobacter sp. B4EP4b]